MNDGVRHGGVTHSVIEDARILTPIARVESIASSSRSVKVEGALDRVGVVILDVIGHRDAVPALMIAQSYRFLVVQPFDLRFGFTARPTRQTEVSIAFLLDDLGSGRDTDRRRFYK